MCFVRIIFSADLLFPECCHEFNLSKSELQGEYAAEENTFHHDQEIIDSPHDNLSDAFDIISNASTDVCCHEDEIVPSEKLEDVEQNDRFTSDSFRSAVVNEEPTMSRFAGHTFSRLAEKDRFQQTYEESDGANRKHFRSAVRLICFSEQISNSLHSTVRLFKAVFSIFSIYSYISSSKRYSFLTFMTPLITISNQ
jgi:hypothetical protein